MNKRMRDSLTKRAAEIIRMHGGKVTVFEHDGDVHVNAAFDEVQFSFDFDKRKLYEGRLVHWHQAKHDLDAHNTTLFDSVNTCHWRKATAHVSDNTLIWEDYLYRASEAAAAGSIFQKAVA
jgi:hypothetical protein